MDDSRSAGREARIYYLLDRQSERLIIIAKCSTFGKIVVKQNARTKLTTVYHFDPRLPKSLKNTFRAQEESVFARSID